MSLLELMLQDVTTVAILGHIRPDGDCVGSCLGMYNYLCDNYKTVKTTVYLEQPSEKFSYLKGFGQICSDSSADIQYDLCICLDSSDKDRFGEFVKYLDNAKKSVCFDHHITNLNYAKENKVVSGASSTCEVIYEEMDPEKVSKNVAECIYTGIVHDTGVFKYSNTSARTMEIAGKMMGMGIDFSSIIDDSFYRKTYVQNQILGRALLESIVFLDGRAIVAVIRQKDMDFYGVTSKDLDGVVEQLRVTEGVECALFLYETGVQDWKVSLRSNKYVDVSKVAKYFGGGGHVRAAGCQMMGSLHDVVNNLSGHIEIQMKDVETCTTE